VLGTVAECIGGWGPRTSAFGSFCGLTPTKIPCEGECFCIDGYRGRWRANRWGQSEHRRPEAIALQDRLDNLPPSTRFINISSNHFENVFCLDQVWKVRMIGVERLGRLDYGLYKQWVFQKALNGLMELNKSQIVKYFSGAAKIFTCLYEEAWEIPGMCMPLCQCPRLSEIGLHLGRYSRNPTLPMPRAFWVGEGI
jgi:hypothetical protein